MQPSSFAGSLDYSLIIPAWNESELIADTLHSVRESMDQVAKTCGFTGELIVVDNNSTDETARIARRAGACKVVFEPVNQIARARNRGTTVASADAYIFLDADTQCCPVVLQQTLELLVSGKVAGGGSLIAPDQPITGVAAAALRWWNRISLTTGMAAGCYIFCRRDAFNEVGGFNDRVYAGEEIYLSRRLKRWARDNGMRFEILTAAPVSTSTRKLAWYGPAVLCLQAFLVLVPGALYCRSLCLTWYDRSKR